MNEKPTSHLNWDELVKRTQGYTNYELGVFVRKFLLDPDLPDDEVALAKRGGMRWDKFRDQFVVRDGRWRLKPGLVVWMTVHETPPL